MFNIEACEVGPFSVECIVRRFLRINVTGTGVDGDMVWIDWELKDAFAFHYLEGIDAVMR